MFNINVHSEFHVSDFCGFSSVFSLGRANSEPGYLFPALDEESVGKLVHYRSVADLVLDL